jgi:hypothetical protein
MALPDNASYVEQGDHERMKSWMQDHGWSITSYASPEDILIISEELTDEDDSASYAIIESNI